MNGHWESHAGAVLGWKCLIGKVYQNRQVPITQRLLLLAFATALCAQDAAVAPLEGTVIRCLGNTHGRSAFELHDPAFPPAGDSLARLRRVQVERQEEKPAVERHGDLLPRTHADKQSAVTLLLVSGIG